MESTEMSILLWLMAGVTLALYFKRRRSHRVLR